jgi:hypothetical protein
VIGSRTNERGTTTSDREPNGATLRPMRLFLLFLLVLLLIGGGIKLAGAQIPILDYPLGGPMAQPQIQIKQPNLSLP